MAIKTKNVHRRWKRFHQKDDEDEFKNLKCKCISLLKVCFDNYVSKMEQEININSKKFWNYINNLKKYNGLPEFMFLGNKIAKEHLQSFINPFQFSL